MQAGKDGLKDLLQSRLETERNNFVQKKESAV